MTWIQIADASLLNGQNSQRIGYAHLSPDHMQKTRSFESCCRVDQVIKDLSLSHYFLHFRAELFGY